MTEDTYATVARLLTEECGVAAELIKPDARLSHELGLSWRDVENMIIEIPDRFDLDLGSVLRGLDLHYLSPYRDREEYQRRKLIGKPPSLHFLVDWARSFEPLTVSDVVRILDAGRYVCREPPLGLEKTVRRLVSRYAKHPDRTALSDDTRLRDDLGFEWDGLRNLLVAIDCELEGAFCAGVAGKLIRGAFVGWQVQENVAGTAPISVGHVLSTVRENRWVGPIGADWRSDIPGMQESRRLTDEEMLRTVKWLLVEQGIEFRNISPSTPLGHHTGSRSHDAEHLLRRLGGILAGWFVLSQEIVERLHASNPGFTFRVSDIVGIAQAGHWPAGAVHREILGRCPNCDRAIPLDSQECPYCKASFGESSTWKVEPILKASI